MLNKNYGLHFLFFKSMSNQHLVRLFYLSGKKRIEKTCLERLENFNIRDIAFKLYLNKCMRYEITLHIDLKLLQFIKALTLLKDIAKLTSSVSKMDEMLEAAILGVQMTMILKKQFITLFLTYFGQIALKLF
jgi:hypothetical protein